MKSYSLRQVLVEWSAIACAVTVFVAAALDTPDDSAPAGPTQALSAPHGG